MIKYIFDRSQAHFQSLSWSDQIQVWINHCMKFNIFKCSDEWHDFLWLQKLRCKWCSLNLYNLVYDDEWLIIWRWCRISLCVSERCVDLFDASLFKASSVVKHSLNYSNWNVENLICFEVIKHKWVDLVQKWC